MSTATATTPLSEVQPEAVGMSSEQLERAGEYVAGKVEDGTLPLAVVLVGRHGKVAFQRSYVNPGVAEQGHGAEPDAVFMLASFTKPLTATLVMQQVERGAISLEAPVAEYIPEFAQNGKEKVTTRHLLSHSSGLSEDSGLWEIETYDEMIEAVCKRGLRFEPGTRGSYCTVGFTVAVEILRRVTGKRLNEIGDQQLFGPLGMSSTQMMRGDGWRNAMVPVFDNDLKVVEERSPPSKDFSVLGGAARAPARPTSPLSAR